MGNYAVVCNVLGCGPSEDDKGAAVLFKGSAGPPVVEPLVILIGFESRKAAKFCRWLIYSREGASLLFLVDRHC